MLVIIFVLSPLRYESEQARGPLLPCHDALLVEELPPEVGGVAVVEGGDAEEHHVVGLHLAELTAGDVEHVAPRGEHFRAFPDRGGGSLQMQGHGEQ